MGSCAQNKYLVSVMKERNYSSDQKKDIDIYTRKYIAMLSNGTAFSNAFNSSPQQRSQELIKSIYCNCYSKLADRCFNKFDKGFSEPEKRIWTKGQAAEISLHASGNGAIADIDMCK
jgi:hypothetical protein